MAEPVQSMTGFASLEGEKDGVAWQFEARSVNGRGLDVRVRLPNGLERVEPELRRLVAATFRRGNVGLSLSLKSGEAVSARYSVNERQLGAYLDAIQAMAASGSVAAPRADGLLALKGVIETEVTDEAATVEPIVVEEAQRLVAALAAVRREEGAHIVPVVRGQLAEIDRLRAAIDAHPERSLEAIKERLERQIDDLVAHREGLSQERLHQEAALMATRADVREELDRLAAHIAAATKLFDEGGPIGRKLDFLCQEFNRETNTICSKAPHHAITALGLELKAVVEQVREQVQNLE